MQVAAFVPTKHLALADPEVCANCDVERDQLRVELTSRALARLVELSFEGVDVVWSDNYFDLPAGRTVAVTCPLPAGWTLEQARAALRVRSVFDSFVRA